MLKINEILIELNNYPDGTLLIKDDVRINGNNITITWKYESDSELFALICLTKHLKNKKHTVNLQMFYCPNSRMDRVKNPEDVFTLKYFAEIINSLGFNRVEILDPHSNVTPALLNNVIINDGTKYIGAALKYIWKYYNIDPIYYFPDYSAMKKYTAILDDSPCIYGNKKRDWDTGKILGIDIVNDYNIDLNGKTVLMIDDIVSYGGSMKYGADKLKELGVEKIFAYATHTENSVLDRNKGTLIKSLENGIVEKLFTTDSLFSGKHEKIEVFKI